MILRIVMMIKMMKLMMMIMAMISMIVKIVRTPTSMFLNKYYNNSANAFSETETLS